MPRTLIRKNPSNFKTLPLFVEAGDEALSYQSVGMPLNFAQTLQRRQHIEVDNPERFSVELANLGVSVRLTLRWQKRDFWIVVRQRREDRADTVLKLISGYVPAHEIKLPLHTAVQEIAEECLLETADGWLTGSYNGTWLPTPYSDALKYRDSVPFLLTPRAGATRPVRCASLNLIERPRAYVHLPTASLQLVYDLHLEVADSVRELSLYHVDEKLENDQLVARLDRRRPDLYLIPLEDGKPRAQLYTLRKGKLLPASTRGIYLAESFARQEGWVIRPERIRWNEWVAQEGLITPAKPRSRLRKLGIKARRIVKKVLHKH